MIIQKWLHEYKNLKIFQKLVPISEIRGLIFLMRLPWDNVSFSFEQRKLSVTYK